MNPFDVILVSLLAVSALPVPSGWAAAVWFGLMVAITFVVRHGSQERASELSRVVLVSPQAGDDSDRVVWKRTSSPS